MSSTIRCMVGLAAALAIMTGQASAQKANTVAIDLPQQSLAESLRAVGKRTETNILIDLAMVRDIQAPALTAELTADQAISRLLAGTGIGYRFIDQRTVVLSSEGRREAVQAPVREGEGEASLRKMEGDHEWAGGVADLARVAQAGDASQGGAVSGAAPASGEKQGSQVPQKNFEQLEEIVVTAQKRGESVLAVPTSIGVTTGEFIERYDLVKFDEIERVMPGLNLDQEHPAAVAIRVRGIPTSTDFYGIEPTVETYWNGITVVPNILFTGMYDLDRVEVLRGPQGTLQGRAAPAGSIGVVTRSPSVDREGLDGTARATLSEDGDYRVDGGVSFGLVPGKLAVRLAGQTSDDDVLGLRNIRTGERQRLSDNGVRYTVAWQPTDAVRAKLTGQWNERENTGYHMGVLGDGSYGPADPYDGPKISVAPANGTQRYFLNGLTLEWDLPGHKLTSISSYSKARYFIDNSFDWQGALPLVDPATGAQQFHNFQDWSARTMSQEAWLQSTDREFWEYLFGAYYNDTETVRDQILRITPTFGLRIDHPFTRKQLGLFTHHRLHFTDKFTLQAGLRWQDYDHFVSARTYDLATGDLFSIDISDSPNKDSGLTWSLQGSYDFVPAVMGYLSYQRGYRTSGQIGSEIIAGPETQYDSETSDAFEIGLKASLLDGRMQFTLDAYRQQFDGLIGSVFVFARSEAPGLPDSNTEVPYNLQAVAQGVELELNARPNEHWLLSAALANNRVKVTSGQIPCTQVDANGVPVAPAAPAVVFTCDGSGRLDAPEWTANASARYTMTHFTWADPYVQGLYSYRDTFPTSLDAITEDFDAYGMLDLYAGLQSKNAAWELQLWVKNVTDEQGLTDGARTFPGQYEPFLRFIRPRTVGLTGTYNF